MNITLYLLRCNFFFQVVSARSIIKKQCSEAFTNRKFCIVSRSTIAAKIYNNTAKIAPSEKRELFHFREYFQPNDPEISHKKFVSISGERYFELCIRPFGNIEGFVFSSIEKLHNLLQNGLDRFDSVISVLRFIFRKRIHVLRNKIWQKI